MSVDTVLWLGFVAGSLTAGWILPWYAEKRISEKEQEQKNDKES